MIFNIGDRVELLVDQTGHDIWGDNDDTLVIEKGSIGTVVVYHDLPNFVLFDCLDTSWMMLDTGLRLLAD